MKKSSRFAKLGRGVCYIIAMIAFVFVLLLATAPWAGAWIDSSWTHRRPVTITAGGNGMPENYQIKIFVTYDPEMQPDFDDLRFALADNTLLAYWIENYNPSENATVWVRLPFSLAANASENIYMYFGNSSVSSAENANSVFPVFDNFSSGWGMDWIVSDPNNRLTFDRTTDNRLEYNLDRNQDAYAYVNFNRGTHDNWVVEYTFYADVTDAGDIALAAFADGVGEFGDGSWDNQILQEVYNVDVRLYQLTYGATDYSVYETVPDASQTWARRIENTENVWLYAYSDEFATLRSGFPISTGPYDGAPLSYFYAISSQNSTGSTGNVTGWLDDIKVRKYITPEPTASIGSKEASGETIVYDAEVDNALVDRGRDADWSIPVLTTQISVLVKAQYPGENRDNLHMENTFLIVRDAAGSVVSGFDNINPTSYENVDENTKRFYFPILNPPDTLPNTALGAWELYAESTSDSGSYDNSSTTTALKVDDLDNTIVPSQENLPKHWHRIYGKTARITGGAVALENGKRVDNNDGKAWASVSGENFENTWAPSAAGTVYFELATAELDGRTNNLDYLWPNSPPEIVLYSSSEPLVDRKLDFDKSSAILKTTLKVRASDPDNRDDLSSARILVRDAEDALQENSDVWSTGSAIDENTLEFTLSEFNPSDSVPNSALGGWDVGGQAADKYGGSVLKWNLNTFTVDDLNVPVNFDNSNPWRLFDITVSGTVSRVSGAAASLDNAWVIDPSAGKMVAVITGDNNYENKFKVTGPYGENMTVTVQALDLPLDGVGTNTYTISLNRFFNIQVRWEDNYELVPEPVDNIYIENRNWHLTFQFYGGGTHETDLKDNPENVVMTAAPKRVVLRDNSKYWRSRVVDPDSTGLEFFVVRDPDDVTAYVFTLFDYTGRYHESEVRARRWYKDNLMRVNDDYFAGDDTVTIYLMKGYWYSFSVWNGTELQEKGEYLADAETNKKILISGIAYVEPIYIGKYITWSASRENGTGYLRVSYSDSSENTENVTVKIYKWLDNSLEYSTVFTEQTWQLTWEQAENENSYQVTIEVNHKNLGSFGGSKMVEEVPTWALPSTPAGGMTGAIKSPIPFAVLASLVAIVVLALAFDAIHAGIAVIAISLAFGFFIWIGFLPGEYGAIAVFLVALAILWKVTGGR